MVKLYKARSLLYRRQSLQENMRWKALDEIHKIYMLLHRSDLNILAKFHQTFSYFSAKFVKFDHFRLLRPQAIIMLSIPELFRFLMNSSKNS